MSPSSRTLTALGIVGAACAVFGLAAIGTELVLWREIVASLRGSSAWASGAALGNVLLVGAFVYASALYVLVGWGLATRHEWARAGCEAVLGLALYGWIWLGPKDDRRIYAAWGGSFVLYVLVLRWLNSPAVRAACGAPLGASK